MDNNTAKKEDMDRTDNIRDSTNKETKHTMWEIVHCYGCLYNLCNWQQYRYSNISYQKKKKKKKDLSTLFGI